jgi:hypothetical protein
VKRSGLATDGLLEMVPLTRDEHELAEKNDPWTLAFIASNAPAYFKRIYLTYHGGQCYLGPPERVAEVREQVTADVHRRRKALGVE